jgi:membrane protein required for colicin V production
LSKVDLTISIIILVGAYSGFRDGFLLEIFSFAAILLGVLFGFKLIGLAMTALEEQFYIDEKALPYISFACVFFIILFIINLTARLLMRRIHKPLLGYADPYAAALIGLLRTSFMMSILIWIFESMELHFLEEWMEDSWVLPVVANFAPGIINGIGSVIPFFRDIF